MANDRQEWTVRFSDDDIARVMKKDQKLGLVRKGDGSGTLEFTDSTNGKTEAWHFTGKQSEIGGSHVETLVVQGVPDHDIVIYCIGGTKAGKNGGLMLGRGMHTHPHAEHFTGYWHADN
jgi:hypothetical protein